MKKYLIYLSIIIFIGCGSKGDYPWFKGSLADIENNIGDKLIMLDFFANW